MIVVDDVGLGLPQGPLQIETLHRFFSASAGGDWMMACHAVRLLATAPKDRTASEHADWVATMVDSGSELVQVPDYAFCAYTKSGQEKGWGLVHWWENGARVENESPAAEHRFRDELIDLHREDEATNGAEPAPSRRTRAES